MVKKIFWFFLVVIPTILLAQSPYLQHRRNASRPQTSSTTLNTSLISYWKMDESAGSTRVDSGGSAQNLTDVNTVGSITGIINNGGAFTNSNSQELNRSDSAALSTGDIDFSFSLWVYPYTVSATRTIIAKGDLSSITTAEYGLYISNAEGGRFNFEVYDGGGVNVIAIQAVVTANTWQHVVIYHDSVNNQVGIIVNNGTPVTASYSAGSWDSTRTFYIGRDQGGRFFDGIIDEVGFWKKVLTPAEITELYSGGAGKTCCPF